MSFFTDVGPQNFSDQSDFFSFINSEENGLNFDSFNSHITHITEPNIFSGESDFKFVEDIAFDEKPDSFPNSACLTSKSDSNTNQSFSIQEQQISKPIPSPIKRSIFSPFPRQETPKVQFQNDIPSFLTTSQFENKFVNLKPRHSEVRKTSQPNKDIPFIQSSSSFQSLVAESPFLNKPSLDSKPPLPPSYIHNLTKKSTPNLTVPTPRFESIESLTNSLEKDENKMSILFQKLSQFDNTVSQLETLQVEKQMEIENLHFSLLSISPFLHSNGISYIEIIQDLSNRLEGLRSTFT